MRAAVSLGKIALGVIGLLAGMVALVLILNGINWMKEHHAKYDPGVCLQQISDGSLIVRITTASRWSGYSFQYWDEIERAWRPKNEPAGSLTGTFNEESNYVKIVCPFSDKRLPQ